MPRFRLPALLVASLVLGSCTDNEPPTAPNFNLAAAPSVDAQITALFPKGLASVARARWASVQKHASRGEEALAKKKALSLIDFTMKKYSDGKLLDPNGMSDPTPERAIGVFVATLFATVYPDLPAPPIDVLEENGTIAIISDTGGTVTAPLGNGAVDFEPGTFATEVLVIVQEIESNAPPGEGPLPTAMAQYPDFFEISTYPATTVAVAARIALCYEVSGPNAPPEASIPGLRVGHQLHTTPDRIQVMAQVDVSDIITCDDHGDESPIYKRQRMGLMQKGIGMLSDAATAAVKTFTPTPLYALHVGIGGELAMDEGFSHFGIVDPHSGAHVCTTPDPSDPSSFDNFADAVAWVNPGGTIEVCPGTYETHDVRITKPLSIRRMGGGTRPLITDTDTTSGSFIIDTMFTAGVVSFRGLAFSVQGYAAIVAQGAYDTIQVIDNQFYVYDSATTSMYAGHSSKPSPLVVFDSNTVVGGEVGMFAPGARMHTRFNTFDSTNFAGIQYQGGATGEVAYNTVTNCGMQGCIRARLTAGMSIHHNTVSSNWWSRVAWGIIADTGNFSIEDNTVTGIGNAGSPLADSSYAFRRAGIQVGLNSQPTVAAVNRNTIANAASGINARFATATGTDNVISNVKRGFLTEFTGSLNVTNSNITGYVNPWTNAVGSTLTCNWWGSAFGPTGIIFSTAGNATWEPWATGPVANGGGGLCDGYNVILGAKRAESAAPMAAPLMSTPAEDLTPVRVGQRAAKLRGQVITLQ